MPLPSLATDPVLLAAVQAGVDAANARLSRVEHVRRFVVLPSYWLPGGEELTPTTKLRRRLIAEKYAAEIEALYAPCIPLVCRSSVHIVGCGCRWSRLDLSYTSSSRRGVIGAQRQ